MPLVRTIAVGFALVGLLMGIAAGHAAPPDAPPLRLVRRGVTTLPQTVATRDGHEVPITGLSGITWLGDDRYAAIMDNSDTLLLFTLPVAVDGMPGAPRDIRLVTLAERHDYEDVAVCPEPLRERIAARQVRRGLADPGQCLLVAEEDTPAIRAVSLADGGLLGVIPIPEIFATRRPNRGLESLDIEPDGRHIWTANEEALEADGPPARIDGGTVVRLAKIPIPEPGEDRREEPRQLAYVVDPPHRFVRVFAGEPLSGVAAVTGLGDGRLLVLERSGCPGLPPFENRIYLVDTREATDVTPVTRDLAARPEDHLPKTLLWQEPLGCNMEGLCLGPNLRGTSRAVLGIADNNGIGTPNQVIAFVLDDAPAAGHLPMVVGGATVVAVMLALVLYRLAR